MALNPEIIAALGRNGDTVLGHLTPGERIIPEGIVDDDLEAALEEAFEKAGINMDAFTVNDNPSINPFTGFQEFFGVADSGADDDAASGSAADDAAAADAAAEGVGGGTGVGGTATAAEAAGGEVGGGLGGGSSDEGFGLPSDIDTDPLGSFNTDPSSDIQNSFLNQAFLEIPNPLDKDDPFTISPFDVMKTAISVAIPGAGLFGLAIHGLEALGLEGLNETADEAVAAQEAAQADAGAGDDGSGIFEQTQNKLNAFSSVDVESGDLIGQEFLAFFEDFLKQRVFDFNFADMPDFSILSDNFGSLKSLDFSFPDDETETAGS